MRFFEWVRRNSEMYVLEDEKVYVAWRYLGRPGPVGQEVLVGLVGRTQRSGSSSRPGRDRPSAAVTRTTTRARGPHR